MFEKENWREIENSNGKYWVSDLGNVARKKGETIKLLKPIPNPKGYCYFTYCNGGKHTKKSISRAVAKAFPEVCGEWFEGCEIDHINTLKEDNRAVNLRVVNHKTNCQNPLTLALRRKGMSDEEWEEYQKERERYFKKKDYEDHKDYYKNYQKEYQKRPEVKEKMKQYYKKYYQKPEVKEKNREKAKQYYYKKKGGLI